MEGHSHIFLQFPGGTTCFVLPQRCGENVMHVTLCEVSSRSDGGCTMTMQIVCNLVGLGGCSAKVDMDRDFIYRHIRDLLVAWLNQTLQDA
eukprot:84162-Amphidinium_carterae.1